jgi:hypothetical protein
VRVQSATEQERRYMRAVRELRVAMQLARDEVAR